VLGTDAGVSAKYSYGFAEHHELGMYVRLGLTPAEAIIASTSRPTEVLGIQDTGVLAKGRRADFLVLNANPLENIRNTREIDGVYLNGAKLDREALRAKFKQAVVDRDATRAKLKKDYVPHPPSPAAQSR
jgi:imidazolonepropionase-like amidohydrolase